MAQPDLSSDAKAKAWIESLIKEIFELADIDTSPGAQQYPVADHACWFAWGPGSTAPTIISVGLPLAFHEDFSCFTFFDDEDEIRVYAMLNKDPAKRPMSPFRLYRLSRHARTYTCKAMTLEVFKQAIADEWSEIANGMSTAEAAYEAVVDYIESLPPGYSLTQLKQDIETGDIDVPETSEPEPPEPEPSGTTPATPPDTESPPN